MKLKKKYIILGFAFLLILFNLFWIKLYYREHTRLKHALIPSLESDYFTKQKIITNYQIQKENNQVNSLHPILEIKLGSAMPYNLYFETKDDYDSFIRESSNQKDIAPLLQNPDYPNGCESASAVMLLNSIGVDITLQDFIEHYLEKDSVYEKNGERYGPNPSFVYAGDPASENRGWGAFEPVISKSILKILEDYHLTNAFPLFFSEMNKIPLYFLAASPYPSVIWVTMDYKESDSVYNWFSYDEKYIYTYPKNSHTVLLTGMDADYYYINDPLKEEKNIRVPREQLESSFDSMGRQFISFLPNEEKMP